MTAYPSNPRRYLALWFPFLPVDRLRRMRRHGGAPAEPLVLVHNVKGALRLAAVSPEALSLGLTSRLTLADAKARIPGLAVADHDPAADAALLGRMAEACDRWTPLVALDSPDGLLLDVTGCSHLLGGEAALRQDVVRRFTQGGFALRAAIAGTPDSARALARFGQGGITEPGADERAARSLPIAALDLDDETRQALSLAGLKRIADLADRPSRPLASRFGEDLVTRLHRVLGREDRRITPLRAPPACLVEQRFAEPIGHLDAVERTLGDLIGQAVRTLEDVGQGGRAFEAGFFRIDGAVRRVRAEAGRPLRDARAILRLMQTRLDSLTDPLDPGYGFDLIQFAVPRVEPLAAIQPGLDGKAVEDDEIAALVDRLVARFGQSRVLRFVAADTHHPERAAGLVPAPSPQTSIQTQWSAPEPGEPPLRPLQLFEPPQQIDTLAETPDGPPLRFRWRRVLHNVTRAEGPERIAPEWWRDSHAPTRDYYRVENEAGHRFWVFRAGLYEREAEQPRWYLHGAFV